MGGREEFATIVLGALQRGTLIHDVGYLEVGMQSSYESLVFGDECVSWARVYLRGVEVNNETLALDEILAVGPGGHHLARRYTRAHSRDFWLPTVFDRVMHDRWVAQGSRTLLERIREQVAPLRKAERHYVADETTKEVLSQLLEECRSERQAAMTLAV